MPSASCHQGYHVSQCGAVGRLTQIDNGELRHFFIGLSQKKTNSGVEDMEFSGVLKKLQEEFPEVN